MIQKLYKLLLIIVILFGFAINCNPRTKVTDKTDVEGNESLRMEENDSTRYRMSTTTLKQGRELLNNLLNTEDASLGRVIIDSAMQFVDKAIALDSTNYAAFNLANDIILSFEEAKWTTRYIDKLIEWHNENHTLYVLRGFMFENINMMDSAMQNYKIALSIVETNYTKTQKDSYLLEKAIVLSFLKKVQEAVQLYETYIKLHPEDKEKKEYIRYLLTSKSSKRFSMPFELKGK